MFCRQAPRFNYYQWLMSLGLEPGSSQAEADPAEMLSTSLSSLNILPDLPEGWEERQDANGRVF
jgi:hypothetical protein